MQVIGCPSFFEMGKDRTVIKKAEIKLDEILLSSSFVNDFLENNYQILQDYYEGSLIKTIAYELKDINEDTFCDLEYRINKIVAQRYKIFSDIKSWKNFVSNFKFTIGPRLHGSILSINSGVPAVCCNTDARTKEMCDFLKIPHMPKLDRNSNILEVYNNLDLNELNNTYTELFDNFVDFFKKNNIEIQNNTKDNEITSQQPVLNLYNDNKNYLNNLKKIKRYKVLNSIFSIRKDLDKKRLVLKIFGIKISIPY